ncbi:MAG: 16S rRNA (adenine(1518)-N(6)/adenine(1519)-N(6))-dimethyltransferase RsmA [Candidatus Cybelea sp.]
MTSPRALLAKAGLRPKKSLGQNFLVSPSTAVRIARLSLTGAPPRSRTLEIGAGTGTLTRALVAEDTELTAIEIDPALVEVLRSREDLGSAQIVQANALDFDYGNWSRGERWRVTGNLPYNIATPLMLRLIEMTPGPDVLTIMVQKDVAQRLVASPASRAYGSLSVAVQYAMSAELLFTVAPRSFFPAPKVDSSVVRLVRRSEPAVAVHDLSLFWKVVRGAFAYRRKTLVNSLALALGVDRATIGRALVSCNLAPELRGERLDLGDFARLADALAQG